MSLRCLAVETATELMSLSACHGDRMASWEARPASGETQHIYRHADRLLAELGTSLSELDCVAFSCGPGSFTGIRMAAAVAQAIAFALQIPVVRRSTLAVLAAGASRAGNAALVATCLDARMGHAYFALYRRTPDQPPQPVIHDALIDPGSYRVPAGEAFFAAGPGWAAYPNFHERNAPRITVTDPDLLPSSRELLAMAIRDYRTGATVSPEQALPEYLGLAPVSLTEQTD